jgi:hypothetical protein
MMLAVSMYLWYIQRGIYSVFFSLIVSIGGEPSSGLSRLGVLSSKMEKALSSEMKVSKNMKCISSGSEWLHGIQKASQNVTQLMDPAVEFTLSNLDPVRHCCNPMPLFVSYLVKAFPGMYQAAWPTPEKGMLSV